MQFNRKNGRLRYNNNLDKLFSYILNFSPISNTKTSYRKNIYIYINLSHEYSMIRDLKFKRKVSAIRMSYAHNRIQ